MCTHHILLNYGHLSFFHLLAVVNCGTLNAVCKDLFKLLLFFWDRFLLDLALNLRFSWDYRCIHHTQQLWKSLQCVPLLPGSPSHCLLTILLRSPGQSVHQVHLFSSLAPWYPKSRANFSFLPSSGLGKEHNQWRSVTEEICKSKRVLELPTNTPTSSLK